MAARINRMHSEQIRLKIKAANLIATLQKAADGHEELSTTRLGAINSLLDRSVPKLSQIQHVGDPANPLQVVTRIELVSGGNSKG